jgi:hypothetical protein
LLYPCSVEVVYKSDDIAAAMAAVAGHNESVLVRYPVSFPKPRLAKGTRICSMEASLLNVGGVAQMCGVSDGVNPERTDEEYIAA